MTENAASTTPAAQPVVVKKYANRRLYNTESSSYITLDNLAEMVRAGRDFVVFDARSGDDITRSVLTQIIVEEENKGHALLPTAFLRQLIGFYGNQLGGLMPKYVEQSFAAFQRQQEQMRDAMAQTIGSILPPGLEEIRKQNVAMMERAMSLFSPFHHKDADGNVVAEAPAPAAVTDEAEDVKALREEIAKLKAELSSKSEAAPPQKAAAKTKPA